MHIFRKLFSKVFSRLVIVLGMILLQLVALILVVSRFSDYFTWFYFVFLGISVIVVLIVINREMNLGYKLAMVIPILLFPLFGGVVYLTLYAGFFNKRVMGRLAHLDQSEREHYDTVPSGMEAVEYIDPTLAGQLRCVHTLCGCPLYANTATRYFPLGDALFPAMKEALGGAREFIYLEYFIIAPGKMWNEILSILRRKAAEGVDVRIIYDDIGTIRHLPWGYEKRLEEMGIKCRVYNPLIPLTAAWQNKRDHRKILVIDGAVAFTGGINLSDEYINATRRFGHWKDAGIMLRGDGVTSFTMMFRCLWELLGEEEEQQSIAQSRRFYLSHMTMAARDGLVMPYGDNPYDRKQIGRDIYLNAINGAKRYIKITTPYFIVDEETLTAIKLAAARGVSITVITPHIADKWYVHLITRSYYRELIEAGVSVYEYTPGFIHAKNLVADGEVGVCGSVNFDYRSFYLQLECGVLMVRSSAIAQMEQDYTKTLSACGQMTLAQMKKEHLGKKLLSSVLRLFAPLM